MKNSGIQVLLNFLAKQPIFLATNLGYQTNGLVMPIWDAKLERFIHLSQ